VHATALWEQNRIYNAFSGRTHPVSRVEQHQRSDHRVLTVTSSNADSEGVLIGSHRGAKRFVQKPPKPSGSLLNHLEAPNQMTSCSIATA